MVKEGFYQIAMAYLGLFWEEETRNETRCNLAKAVHIIVLSGLSRNLFFF